MIKEVSKHQDDHRKMSSTQSSLSQRSNAKDQNPQEEGKQGT